MGVQLRYDVGGPPERQTCLGPPLDRVQPQLCEPGPLGAGPRLVLEAGVRGPAPPVQRTVEKRHRLVRCGGGRGGDLVGEEPGVDGVRRGPERVARPFGDQQPGRFPGWALRLQRAPQRRDEGADGAHRARRRFVPEVVDEVADRDDPAVGDRPGARAPPVFRPPDVDRRTGAVPGDHRPEDTEPDLHRLPTFLRPGANVARSSVAHPPAAG